MHASHVDVPAREPHCAVGDGATMMVISFRKGMAAPFFPFPMGELRDRVVDADLIWGGDFAGFASVCSRRKRPAGSSRSPNNFYSDASALTLPSTRA